MESYTFDLKKKWVARHFTLQTLHSSNLEDTSPLKTLHPQKSVRHFTPHPILFYKKMIGNPWHRHLV
jgi:hypothetical protein